MTETAIIISAYDLTEELIKKNPENENNIINDYINFIIKLKNNNNLNKTYIRSSTYRDDNYRHPLDINIENNFQRYSNGELIEDDMNNRPYYYPMRFNYLDNQYMEPSISGTIDPSILTTDTPVTPITDATTPPATTPPATTPPAVATPPATTPAVATPAATTPAVATPAATTPAVATFTNYRTSKKKETFADYFAEITGGFKDYFAFKN